MAIGMALDAVVRVAIHIIVFVVHVVVVVTVGARPLRCIAARMAFGADAVSVFVIYRERVIERRVTPIAGVVTLAALPREVIGRSIAGVTRLTIGLARVIESCITPVVGVVAGAALPRKVIGRFITCMAG